MLKRLLFALSAFAFLVAPISAVQAAPPGSTTSARPSQPLGYERWYDAYYLNHPNNADHSMQTAHFMARRDTELLFPATETLQDFDFDGYIADSQGWTDKSISPNREYTFVTEQQLLHEYFNPGEGWANYTVMSCERENLATHEIAATRCNFKNMLSRIEFKDCIPTSTCAYQNPWGARNHTATSVTKAYFSNASHSWADFNYPDSSVRARNPCMRARFLNPFSNPAWQSLHLTNWYKGTTAVVDIYNHRNIYVNLDTVGMNSVSSSEKTACEAAD